MICEPPELIGKDALIGIPSTTISACELPPKELFPRIVILEAEPKDPDCEIWSPATLPARELARLLSLIVFTFSPDTCVTA